LSVINKFSKQSATKNSVIFLSAILIIGMVMLTVLSIRILTEDNLHLILGNDLGSSRLFLTLNTLDLIQDFPFTGGGLSAFSGLYSHYILLIPYHYSTHSHNLFLNVALEQGLLGAFALSGILLITVILLMLQPIEIDSLLPNWLIKGTLAACLLAFVIHGLIDDPLYSSVGVLFLFLIPGIVISWTAPAQQRDSWRSVDKWVTIFLGAALVLMLLSIIFYKPLSARWQANLGAVDMAKVELKDWPSVEWNDGSKVIFLSSDETRFEQSLIANPGIRTSYHGLGHIAMLRNEYDDAIPYLQMAYNIDPHHYGIKKALGYSRVWVGDIDSALEILDGVPEAETELQTYVWWWATKGREDLADQALATLAEMENRK
ncbi:MAG: O-antigen ligase family protein, partial [Anaerolineae bacterium]|nr:O-antigen ligase family protein [Anaerolineae bacterium]